MSPRTAKKQGKVTSAPLWMWAIAMLGLALVFGSIAFMLYEAAAGDASPPDVTVRVDSIFPTKDGFLVMFRAINQGGSTAEGLTIEGEIKKADGSVETSNTTIEYVPSHSEREGGLFFSVSSKGVLYQS